MQPDGADDWLQCFRAKNVVLPEEGYIGVTAMTGELVDKHHMIGIQMYNNIKGDPFATAVEYDNAQLPMMWEDMKHSGEVAREYQQWEKDVKKETDFSLRDLYADYYYTPYSMVNDGYNEKDDESMSSESYYAESTPKFEKPSYKNNYRTDLPVKKHQKQRNKKQKQGKVDKTATTTATTMSPEELKNIKLTKEDYEKIEEMISGTSIATEIKTLHEERRKRMRQLRQHMEAGFEEASGKMTNFIKRLREKEYELSRRIERVGAKLDIHVEQLFAKSESKGGGWFLPFLFVLFLVVSGTGFAFRKYRQHMKTHLL